MSESQVKKAFRTTKLKINKETVPSNEQRVVLESLFLTMEAAKTDSVTAERNAAIASAKSKSKLATAHIAELEFLQTASSNFSQVAGDRMWIIYRDKDGTITLEGFTERLIRNNIRAQQEMLGNQIANSSDGDVDRTGLYEEEGNDEDTLPEDMN